MVEQSRCERCDSTVALPFPGLLAAHVVSMALFGGLIAVMDLRLAGVAYVRTRISTMQRQRNALFFHRRTYRCGLVNWDAAPVAPRAVRVAGAISLLLWAGVVVLGRVTAYEWLTYE